MTEPAPGRAHPPLCIAHVTSERRFSGGEVQVFLLIDGLRRRGHRCVLYCPARSPSADEARRRGITCVPVALRHGADVPSLLTLARSFRQQGVHLVHSHTSRATWLGGLAARLAGVPAVSTRRMERPVARGWRTGLIYQHLIQRVLPISPAVRDGLLAAGVPSARIELIPEGVDPQVLQASGDRDACRTALGVSAADVVILALCALIRRKGMDVLLDALALLAADGLRPRVWIAGDGPERAALTAQAQRLALGGQVAFLGQRGDAPALLAACDVFVMPSRSEGLGVAALEAMAAGRAVVCSEVGGLAYSVVHQRTGLLVPPDSPPALATALAQLLKDGGLRARLGAEGPRRIAEGFLASQMVSAHEELYRTVLHEPERGEVRRCAPA